MNSKNSIEKKKKITIAILVIICVAIIFGHEILFPTYKTLDINEDSIKCIKVESYNKTQNFTFESDENVCGKLFDIIHDIDEDIVKIK